MANVTFSGDPKAPGTDPAEQEFFGIKFPLGKAVEVSDDAIVAKLRSHSHFTIDGPATKGEALVKARAAKASKKKPAKDIDA